MTPPAPAIGTHVPVVEGVVLSDSDSESDADNTSFTPRRQQRNPPSARKQPGWKLKKPINYQGIFAMFGQEADVSLKSTSKIYKADSVFLSILDLDGEGFKSTPATRALDHHRYLTSDDTYEDIHPLAFVAKVKSHDDDNPTYTDVLRCSNDERKL